MCDNNMKENEQVCIKMGFDLMCAIRKHTLDTGHMLRDILTRF